MKAAAISANNTYIHSQKIVLSFYNTTQHNTELFRPITIPSDGSAFSELTLQTLNGTTENNYPNGLNYLKIIEPQRQSWFSKVVTF